MKNYGFYNSIAYKERQSEIARKNWQNGIYDFLRKREKRQCTNPDCGKWFEAQLADPKKFCSRKCAAQINNPKRSNTPPDIREKLIKLYQICRVNETKIKAALNIFDDVDHKKAINFWSKITGIPVTRFSKTMIRKNRGGTYKNKSPYGTLAIYVPNIKLKTIIDEWCKNALT